MSVGDIVCLIDTSEASNAKPSNSESPQQSIKDEKLLSEFFSIYDIKFTEIDTAMNDFISIRNKLRNEKKYGEADEMRDSILKIGIVINDGENVGWYWKNS